MHRILDDASHVVPISAPQDGDVRRQLAELRHRRVEKRRVIGNVDSYIRYSNSLACIKTRREERRTIRRFSFGLD